MAPPIKPTKQKLPALHGRLMVDTINGRVRVRAWPKKRGPDVPHQVRIQNERFTAAQRLAKTAKGSVMNKFIDATKNTGLYPRDLFTKLCLAPPIEVEMLDGRVITYRRPQLESCLFQGFRLERTAPWGMPPTTLAAVPWDDPVIDTAAFWEAGFPSRITIPEGVAVIEFSAGIALSSTIPGPNTLYLARIAPTQQFVAMQEWGELRRATLTTGPMPVQEGEQYEVQVFFQGTRETRPVATFFTGTILAAEI